MSVPELHVEDYADVPEPVPSLPWSKHRPRTMPGTQPRPRWPKPGWWSWWFYLHNMVCPRAYFPVRFPPLSLVRPVLASSTWVWRVHEYEKGSPIALVMRTEGLDPYAHYVYLGMCPNVPGHCAVVTEAGNIIWWLHPEEFELVPDDDC